MSPIFTAAFLLPLLRHIVYAIFIATFTIYFTFAMISRAHQAGDYADDDIVTPAAQTSRSRLLRRRRQRRHAALSFIVIFEKSWLSSSSPFRCRYAIARYSTYYADIFYAIFVAALIFRHAAFSLLLGVGMVGWWCVAWLHAVGAQGLVTHLSNES